MYVGIYTIVSQIVAEYFGVTGSNLFADKPPQTIISLLLGYGKRQAALTEAQFAYHIHSFTLLEHFIKSNDAYMRRPRCHAVGDIIVAQKQEFYRKISRWHQQSALYRHQFDAGFAEKLHCLIIESAFRLYCYS